MKGEVTAEAEVVVLLKTAMRQFDYKVMSRGDQGLDLEDGTGRGKHGWLVVQETLQNSCLLYCITGKLAVLHTTEQETNL